MAEFNNDGWEVFGQGGGTRSVLATTSDEFIPYTDTVIGYKYIGYGGNNYIRCTDAAWLDISITYVSSIKDKIDFDVNITTTTSGYKSARVYVKDESGEIYFDIYQYAAYNKLWSSVTASISSDNFNFIIKDSNHKDVFEGTAYSPSGGTVFNITPVAQSLFTRPGLYIPNRLETTAVEDVNITKMLVLTNKETGDYITAAPYIYNWDYAGSLSITVYTPSILNSPIMNTITPNMFPTVTAYLVPGSWKFDLVRNGVIIETVKVSEDFNTSDVTRASTRFKTLLKEGDVINVYNITDTSKSITYKVVCGDSGFYYLNKEGAYDIFTINTNVKVIDTYNRTNYTRDATYGTYIFGEVNISNRIDTEYETSTGWLTDEQSEKFATEFLQSPQVYFVNGDNISPVNITNSSVEHKMFRNGRNLNQYTITYKLSQYKIIR